MERLAASVRMVAANGMQQEKGVRMHAKEFFMDAEGVRRAAKERHLVAKDFPRHEKKLRDPGKSPGRDANFSRGVGKIPGKDAGVFLKEDPAAPKLRKTPFKQTFFPCTIPGKKSKDVFSFRRVDPPARQHACSAFVLKQRAFVSKRRAFVHAPADAVHKDDSVQHSAMAGREVMARIVQQVAMGAS